MSNESNAKMAKTSATSVKQYIALRQENCNRHQAYVLVHADGRDCCSGVRIVFANVSEGKVELIIEGFDTIYRDRSNKFTVENSTFSLISRTLQIKSKDTFGKPISVEITGV